MKKAIFITIVVLILAFAGWFFFIRMTKERAVKIIYKADTTRDTAKINAMGDEFLIAWAKAIRGANPEFTYNGKMYNTGTATAK